MSITKKPETIDQVPNTRPSNDRMTHNPAFRVHSIVDNGLVDTASGDRLDSPWFDPTVNG